MWQSGKLLARTTCHKYYYTKQFFTNTMCGVDIFKNVINWITFQQLQVVDI